MEKLSIKELYTAIDKLTNKTLENRVCPFFEAILLSSAKIERNSKEVCLLCPFIIRNKKGVGLCKSYKTYSHYDYLDKPNRIPQLKKDFIKRFPTVILPNKD